MPIIRYTPEEKEKALRLFSEMGATRASRETGVTVDSLRKWRADAQETSEFPAANELLAQKAVMQPSPSQTNFDESGAIVARLTRKHSRKAPQSIGSFPCIVGTHADEKANDELTLLRIENTMLKAQIVALKGALRAFTE